MFNVSGHFVGEDVEQQPPALELEGQGPVMHDARNRHTQQLVARIGVCGV